MLFLEAALCGGHHHAWLRGSCSDLDVSGNFFPFGPEKKCWFEHRAITLMLSETLSIPLLVVVCLAFWCRFAVNGVIGRLCSWSTQSPSVLLLCMSLYLFVPS